MAKVKTCCPYCEKPFTDATGIGEGQGKVPRHGDITMCLGCGKFSTFEFWGRGGKGLRLRPPNQAERDELASDPEAFKLWMVWRQMVSTEGMTRQ